MLLTDSLEGLAVLFDIHELARLGVALRPLLGGGVVDLAAITYLPFAVTVSGVLGQLVSPPSHAVAGPRFGQTSFWQLMQTYSTT